MKLRMEGDSLIIETDRGIEAPYLRKTKTGYKTYWHFIRDLSRKHDFEIDSELREAIQFKVDQVKAAKRLLIEEGDPEEFAFYFDKEFKQYSFQAKAVRFIVQQKSVLLADDVGLGKTAIALTAILELIECQNKTKFLIVVPASLRFQWLSEIRKFLNRDMFPDLEVVINNRPAKERSYVYKNFVETDNPIILVTSYDMIRRDKEKLKKFPVDMIVLDEATKIKTRKTKINKAVRNLFCDVEFKLAMTATPIENGLEDLYCICEFLDKRKLYSKGYFESRFCIVERKRLWHRKIDIFKVVGYKNISEVREKLAGLYIRRTVGDVEIELPDIVRQNIFVELTKEQVALYDEVVGKTFGDMTREDLLGQMIYLQEICDSAELLDPTIKASSKMIEIKRLLDEDLRYSKVIMISRFKKFANILHRELKKVNHVLITGDVSMEERTMEIARFNTTEECRLMIGTEAIQTGQNLQVASVLVNCDLPWNPASLQQRIGRLHRIGSEHETIRMINLIVKDTIEEKVLYALYEKGMLFEKMFKRDEQVKIGSLLGMSAEDIKDMIGSTNG